MVCGPHKHQLSPGPTFLAPMFRAEGSGLCSVDRFAVQSSCAERELSAFRVFSAGPGSHKGGCCFGEREGSEWQKCLVRKKTLSSLSCQLSDLSSRRTSESYVTKHHFPAVPGIIVSIPFVLQFAIPGVLRMSTALPTREVYNTSYPSLCI